MSGPGAGPRPAVLRVALAVVLLVAAFSLINPLMAIRLQAQGLGPRAIGLWLMLPFLGVALALPLLPALYARHGLARMLRLGLVAEALATATYLAEPAYPGLAAAAFLGGWGAAATWNATEALIAFHAPPEARGRWTGLYQTALGGSLALGPWLPGLLGWGVTTGLGVAFAVQLFGILLVQGPQVQALRAAPESGPAAPPMGLGTALRRHPGLAWTAFVGGVFEAGLAALAAAEGAALGWTLGAAAALAGVLGLGSFLLQAPAGWLADRTAPRTWLGAAAVLLLWPTLPLALGAPAQPWLWAAVAAWGGVGGALYTLTMVRVAQRLAARGAVAGTGLAIAGYTAGGALGPLASGALLEAGGLPALAAGLSLMAASLAVQAVAAPAGRPGA